MKHNTRNSEKNIEVKSALLIYPQVVHNNSVKSQIRVLRLVFWPCEAVLRSILLIIYAYLWVLSNQPFWHVFEVFLLHDLRLKINQNYTHHHLDAFKFYYNHFIKLDNQKREEMVERLFWCF